jgi:hypothetical protein
MWNHTVRQFRQFLNELELKTAHRSDADGKAERVARCATKLKRDKR